MSEIDDFRVSLFRPVIVLSCMIYCVTIQAQVRNVNTEVSGRIPGSLAIAIEQALTRRLDIRISELDVRQASNRVRQARARFRPRVGLSLEYSNTRRWDDYAGISAEYDMPGVGRTRIDVTSETPRYQLQPVIEANYSLYSGGGDSASLRQAEASEQSAKFGLQMTSQRVILDVASRYLDLRRSCVNRNSAVSAVELARARSDLMEGRSRGGRMAEIELRAEKLALMEKRSLLVQRNKQVAATYDRYASAIADLSTQEIDADSACKFDHTLKDELRTVMAMKTFMPKQEKNALDIVAAKEQIAIERAVQKPQVSLFARYGYVGRQDHSLNDLLPDTRRQEAVMGVRLSVDLYDGGLGSSRVSAAKAELERRQLEQEQHIARVERYKSYSNSRREELKQALELAQAKYELERSRLLLVEERFRSGKEAFIEVAENRFRTQEASRELEIVELDMARLELEFRFFEESSESANQ